MVLALARLNGHDHGDVQDATESTTTTCACTSHFGPLDAEHHDWLLTVEQRGFEGVCDLISYLALDHDCEPTRDHLSWLDFPEFVSCHNWRDPVRVSELAETIDRYLRSLNPGA